MGTAGGSAEGVADEAALADLERRQVEAWVRDGVAFAATFTEDADFVDVVGGHLRALAAIAESLQDEILPAFVGLLAQPKVLARFTTLPPSAKGMDLREALAAHLHAERDLGRLRRDADVDAAATLLTGACKELILPHLFRPATERLRVPPGFVDAVVRTVLSGIRTA